MGLWKSDVKGVSPASASASASASVPVPVPEAVAVAATASEHAVETAHRGVPGNPRGGQSGAPLHATQEAAGAPSAWSQSFNHPPRDHADGATLVRLRRTRRPVLRDAVPAPVPHRGFGNSISVRDSNWMQQPTRNHSWARIVGGH